jgi:hypothetical protein
MTFHRLFEALLFLGKDLDIRFCFRKLLRELHELGNAVGEFVRY